MRFYLASSTSSGLIVLAEPVEAHFRNPTISASSWVVYSTVAGGCFHAVLWLLDAMSFDAILRVAGGVWLRSQTSSSAPCGCLSIAGKLVPSFSLMSFTYAGIVICIAMMMPCGPTAEHRVLR